MQKSQQIISTARATKRDLKAIKTDVEETKKIFLGKKVRHSKTGNIYTVCNVTAFVTTQEPMIHYSDEKINIEWCRTVDDFTSQDTINGELINKFVLID